jgi:hypothetical protein
MNTDYTRDYPFSFLGTREARNVLWVAVGTLVLARLAWEELGLDTAELVHLELSLHATWILGGMYNNIQAEKAALKEN